MSMSESTFQTIIISVIAMLVGMLVYDIGNNVHFKSSHISKIIDLPTPITTPITVRATERLGNIKGYQLYRVGYNREGLVLVRQQDNVGEKIVKVQKVDIIKLNNEKSRFIIEPDMSSSEYERYCHWETYVLYKEVEGAEKP